MQFIHSEKCVLLEMVILSRHLEFCNKLDNISYLRLRVQFKNGSDQKFSYGQVSISPTFYARRTYLNKSFVRGFLYSYFRFELLLAKEYWRKCAYRKMVKLTTGRTFYKVNRIVKQSFDISANIQVQKSLLLLQQTFTI